MTRRAKLGLALGVAAVLAGGLIVASVLATREGDTTVVASGATLPGAAEVAARLPASHSSASPWGAPTRP